MRKLRIECFDLTIFFFNKDEREKFEKAYGCDVGGSYGYASGNGCWIGEHDDLVGVCYHEASHLADWVIEQRLECRFADLGGSTEIRAYLTEFIGNKLRDYICKRRK